MGEVRDIRNIVILTGAGISAESGLATFRGPDGLWEGHRVEVCARCDLKLIIPVSGGDEVKRLWFFARKPHTAAEAGATRRSIFPNSLV